MEEQTIEFGLHLPAAQHGKHEALCGAQALLLARVLLLVVRELALLVSGRQKLLQALQLVRAIERGIQPVEVSADVCKAPLDAL